MHNSQNNQPLLHVENVEKRYPRAGNFGRREELSALCGVSFSIDRGTTTALVGESGSGKSTLALCVACLERPTSGKIWLDGTEITCLNEKELRAMRPQIQLVFQDPARSLNPRWTAMEIVSEPLFIQGRSSKQQRRERAVGLLERVGISAEKISQRPHELSGGQRQRLAIARALALEPQLLILDEALSALDLSVQAQIVNLLLELQHSLGLTYLFITHDLAMAAHLSDQIAVMDQGKIVEIGAAKKVLLNANHPTTQRLIVETIRPLNSPGTLQAV